jgi:hypothetical protein
LLIIFFSIGDKPKRPISTPQPETGNCILAPPSQNKSERVSTTLAKFHRILLNWEFSRYSRVTLIRGFNNLYCSVLSRSYFTEDYYYNCVCVRAP